MGVHPSYCTEPLVPPATLTPISLPDTSFRPSPVLSHHSQEYPQQKYHYNYSDAIPQQGLGISGPFPSDYPQITSPSSGYAYAPAELPLTMGPTPSASPQAPPFKRVKPMPSTTPSRDTPINILPHPDGVLRIECERLNPRTPPLIHPRPRAPGRGRRDPQAEQEDAFVENLREQNLAWRVVRQRFQERFNKDASEARLQMRLLRRRKERLARWDDSDVST